MGKLESDLVKADNELAEACGWVVVRSGMDGHSDTVYLRGRIGFSVERKRPGKEAQKNQLAMKEYYDLRRVPYHILDAKDLGGMQKLLIEYNALVEALRKYDARV